MCGAAIPVSYVLSRIVQGHRYLILCLGGTELLLWFSQVFDIGTYP